MDTVNGAILHDGCVDRRLAYVVVSWLQEEWTSGRIDKAS